MMGSENTSRASVSTSGKPKRSRCNRFYNGPFWNIFLLALAWAATLTSSTLLTTIGPLSAKSIGGSDAAATFTIGAFLIGAAVSSVPSGAMFRILGRKNGFYIGCIMQVIGGGLGMLAVNSSDSTLLVVGCGFVGLGQGIGQFYRFSATEMTPDKYKARAVTYVLTGGVLAAFLGPVSANYSRDMFGKEYLGGFFSISLIGICNLFVVYLARFPVLKTEKQIIEEASAATVPLVSDDGAQDDDTRLNTANNNNTGDSVALMHTLMQRRSFYKIISQPLFIISCLIPTSAHTMMVMLMSSVTLAMEHSGFDFNQSSTVMVMHFLAMFGPGFFTGSLIGKYGALLVSMLGGMLFAASTIVMWVGEGLVNYYAGMILCGVGWNFSFSAGTVMLMGSYKPEEATDVQAFNDFVLFSIAGGGSLISGIVFSIYGWQDLIYVVGVVVILNCVLFLVSWRIKSKLEQERTASNLYQAINPAVIEKALAGEEGSFAGGASGHDRAKGLLENLGNNKAEDYDSEEYEDGVVAGVEWWQPAGQQEKSFSFAVFGRKENSSDSNQQEVMMRSASVI